MHDLPGEPQEKSEINSPKLFTRREFIRMVFILSVSSAIAIFYSFKAKASDAIENNGRKIEPTPTSTPIPPFIDRLPERVEANAIAPEVAIQNLFQESKAIVINTPETFIKEHYAFLIDLWSKVDQEVSYVVLPLSSQYQTIVNDFLQGTVDEETLAVELHEARGYFGADEFLPLISYLRQKNIEVILGADEDGNFTAQMVEDLVDNEKDPERKGIILAGRYLQKSLGSNGSQIQTVGIFNKWETKFEIVNAGSAIPLPYAVVPESLYSQNVNMIPNRYKIQEAVDLVIVYNSED